MLNTCNNTSNNSDSDTIVIGALRAIAKELVKGLENLEMRGQEETIQVTAL